MDSRFRGNDSYLSYFVIPAKAGIYIRYPYLLSYYVQLLAEAIFSDLAKKTKFIRLEYGR